MTTHLIAFLFPLCLFAFWGAIGYPLLNILDTRRHTLRNLLLAPTFGMAITLLPVFWLNRLGYPVIHFALLLTLFYFILAFLLWFFICPVVPLQQYKPFVGILLLTLCLVGWPLLKYGFHWFSYVNDDMNNYCLGAIRFLHNGYSTFPNAKDMYTGKNYSLFYWLFHVACMVRAGSELQLAWIAGTLTLPPLQLFMPVVIALHLCLVSASGALVLRNRQWRKTALLTTTLVAVSALTTLGSMYQLIAQVGGVALLIALTIWLLQTFSIHRRYYFIRIAVLLSIVATALFIYYPEVSPILGVSYLFYILIKVIKGWRPTQTYFLISCVALILCAGFLNIYMQNVFVFLHTQLQQGFSKSNIIVALFPYFLIPSGLANLFGILCIGLSPSWPIVSFDIFVGGCLLLFIIISTIRLSVKYQYGYAITSLTILFLATTLFINNSGFGLFKLAMYAQPFFLAILATALCSFLKHKRKIFLLCVSVFILFNLSSQFFYVTRSLGTPGSFQELPYASQYNIPKIFNNIAQFIPKNNAIAYCSPSITLSKMLAQYNNHISSFISQQFFKEGFVDADKISKLNQKNYRYAETLRQLINAHFEKLSFFIPVNTDNTFIYQKNFFQKNKNVTYIFTTKKMDILNRSYQTKSDSILNALTYKKAQNHLIFINSHFGQYYYCATHNKHISLYQLENDLYYSGKTMAGIGRYLLFQIVNQSPKARLVLNISDTLLKNKKLPPATLIGNKTKQLPLVGDGSARIISQPIQPQIIHGIPYIMLDMGRNGHAFKTNPTGLMALYGKQATMDNRLLTTFARNISVVSNKQYQAMQPPTILYNFPTDFSNPNLFYSGMYEDGWISQNSYLYLSHPSKNHYFIFQGLIPVLHNNINDLTTITIVINHKKITQKMQPGYFNIIFPIKDKLKKEKINIHFSQVWDLPNPDNRPVSAQIIRIGFVSNKNITIAQSIHHSFKKSFIEKHPYIAHWAHYVLSVFH